MPYVPQAARAQLPGRDMTPGELNFAITRCVALWIAQRGLSYTTLNEAIGVLECVKLELYRRIAAPYEDMKIRENGDVYPTEIITP